MIPYARTQWYGWNYMFRCRGSVLFRVIPVSIFSTVLAVVVSTYGDELMDALGYPGEFRDLMGHPYAMQLFGNVFGYLTVNRITTSYSRYWEGVTVVKNMHSKWADACGQILNFDRVQTVNTDLTDEPFCRHIVRLFSQLSAMATMRLHVDDAMENNAFEKVAGSGAGAYKPEPRVMKQRSFLRKATQQSSTVQPETSVLRASGMKRTETSPHCSIDALKQVSKKHHEGGSKMNLMMSREEAKRSEVDELTAGMTADEARMLMEFPCPVLATAQRIQRAIITRQASGGCSAPPPIVSRIFQEISNGLLAYNNAAKMKEVPVPFAYVQYNAVVLNVFAILCPIAMACFSGSSYIAGILTFFVVGSFYAIFILN